MHPTAPPIESILRFRSEAYPDGAPGRWVFTRMLIRPLAMCVLPVMIGALVAVLEGFSPLPYLFVGFPLAMSLASVWTLFRMQATVAEIYITGSMAAVRTVWECIRGTQPLRWLPILEVRTSPDTLTVAIGDASYEFDSERWAKSDQLFDALRAAVSP